MKFTNKELILFDLDGTLVDSVPDLASALNNMLRTLERKTFSQDEVRSWIGNGTRVLVKRGLSGSSTIDEMIDPVLFTEALDIFLTYYAKHLCVDTITYPNVLTTLQALKAKNYRLALVTNKPYGFIEPLLKGLELMGLFELMIGGDSLSRRKPDPLPLLHVCERLNVSVSQCLMVGDSKNDILAAKAANMQSIGVTYGYNYDESISLYQPSSIIDDFSEILNLLDER